MTRQIEGKCVGWEDKISTYSYCSNDVECSANVNDERLGNLHHQQAILRERSSFHLFRDYNGGHPLKDGPQTALLNGEPADDTVPDGAHIDAIDRNENLEQKNIDVIKNGVENGVHLAEFLSNVSFVESCIDMSSKMRRDDSRAGRQIFSNRTFPPPTVEKFPKKNWISPHSDCFDGVEFSENVDDRRLGKLHHQQAVFTCVKISLALKDGLQTGLLVREPDSDTVIDGEHVDATKRNENLEQKNIDVTKEIRKEHTDCKNIFQPYPTEEEVEYIPTTSVILKYITDKAKSAYANSIDDQYLTGHLDIREVYTIKTKKLQRHFTNNATSKMHESHSFLFGAWRQGSPTPRKTGHYLLA
ncbi:unnamed protein product [Caenorhabditis nigoni]